MQDKILKVIRENLNGVVADELLKFIEQAKKDQASLKLANDKNERLNKDYKVVVLQKAELEREKSAWSCLKKKEEDLKESQRELRVSKLEFQLVEANKRAGEIKDLVGILFQNQSLVTNRVTTVPIVRKDPYNQLGEVIDSHTGSEREVVSKEKLTPGGMY